MTHDPMCPHDEGAYHELGENSCVCDLIARVRADERAGDFIGWITPAHHAERMRENYDLGYAAALASGGICWREADGSQIPSGAIRVYREAGWFWEMP